MLSPADLAIWISVLLILILVLYVVRRRPSAPRVVAVALGALYLAAVLGVTFGPIPLDAGLIEKLPRRRRSGQQLGAVVINPGIAGFQPTVSF